MPQITERARSCRNNGNLSSLPSLQGSSRLPGHPLCKYHCIPRLGRYTRGFNRSRCTALAFVFLVFVAAAAPDLGKSHGKAATWKCVQVRGFFMRGALRMLGLATALMATVGCHHDKYNMKPEHVEEYYLPPDEPRYNLPDTAPYKKPPQQKDDTKTGAGKAGMGSGPGGMGGF